MSHLGGPTQYVAFRHDQVLPAGKGEAAAPAKAAAEKPAGSPTETAEAAPESSAVDQLIESQPDTPVLVGYDVEGNPIKTTLAEAHAESMAQLERDLADTKAYEAAITCFLGRGA